MLINETKNKVWHGKVKLADTFFKRFKGLMLTPNINYALVFILPAETRTNASIHMFFMFQSIDVIFLNSAREVVDFKKAKPWRVYMPRDAAKYIIEGPVGIIKALDVEIGDKINWIVEDEKGKAVPLPSNVINGVSFKKINGTISLAEPKPKLKEP
ncbi:DUF192 domain-containing protein [Thermococcus sp. M39]|uniref:DUF192 domain-containing protein n=1 Tax=unclassified Thermococcus TaxID=2627626 RepID=UPI00143918F8|nr:MULTISPECIES: DUF192 domain-containing protein [unclassified Thermococcus]NJE08772.1 DUF192 domain-containing protein [Thermococcus sp. M39]NJE12005.1 DUF192 domain-containing protein [Thermococcus sp. LS2]